MTPLANPTTYSLWNVCVLRAHVCAYVFVSACIATSCFWWQVLRWTANVVPDRAPLRHSSWDGRSQRNIWKWSVWVPLRCDVNSWLIGQASEMCGWAQRRLHLEKLGYIYIHIYTYIYIYMHLSVYSREVVILRKLRSRVCLVLLVMYILSKVVCFYLLAIPSTSGIWLPIPLIQVVVFSRGFSIVFHNRCNLLVITYCLLTISEEWSSICERSGIFFSTKARDENHLSDSSH